MSNINLKIDFHIIKKYYLWSFVIFFIAFLVFLYFNEVESRTKIFLLKIAIIGSFTFGTFRLMMVKYYRPYRVRQMLNKLPIKRFYDIKFVSNGDNVLKGVFLDYSIYIGCFWEEDFDNPTIFYQILFNPKQNGEFLTQKRYDLIFNDLRRNNQIFGLNCIIKKYYLGGLNTKPSFDKICEDISQSIKYLKENNLNKIEFDEWESLLPEMQKLGKTLNNFTY